MNRFATSAIALALLGWCALQAQAQTGVVQGTVTDSSGAVIPGATVKLLSFSEPSIVVDQTKSDQSGAFVFPNISPGSYVLEVSSEGFVTIQQHVNVVAGRRTKATITLPIGAVTETVTVSGLPPRLSASTSRVKQPARGAEPYAQFSENRFPVAAQRSALDILHRRRHGFLLKHSSFLK